MGSNLKFTRNQKARAAHQKSGKSNQTHWKLFGNIINLPIFQTVIFIFFQMANSSIWALILIAVALVAVCILSVLVKKKYTSATDFKYSIRVAIFLFLHFFCVLIICGIINAYWFEDGFDFQRKQLYCMVVILLIGAFVSIILWVLLRFFNKGTGVDPNIGNIKKILKIFKYAKCEWIGVCASMMAATVLMYAFPNTIPHFINNFPHHNYNTNEKMLERTKGIPFSLAADGEKGKIIFRFGGNYVKYIGPYENYEPSALHTSCGKIFKNADDEKNDEPFYHGNFKIDAFTGSGEIDFIGQIDPMNVLELPPKWFKGRYKGYFNKGDANVKNQPISPFLQRDNTSFELDIPKKQTVLDGIWTLANECYPKYDRYEGELKFDESARDSVDIHVILHGEGTLHWEDGSCLKGTYKDGKIVEGILTTENPKTVFGENNPGYLGEKYSAYANHEIAQITIQYKDAKPSDAKLIFSGNNIRGYEIFEGKVDKNAKFIGEGTIKLKNDDRRLTVNFDDTFDDDGYLIDKYYQITNYMTELYENYEVKVKRKDNVFTGEVKILFKENTELYLKGYRNFIGEINDNGYLKNGVLKYENGNIYEGPFRENKPHTEHPTRNTRKQDEVGIMIYKSGKKYNGQWQNGIRCGTGTLTFPDGHELSEYVGSWSGDKPHGDEKYRLTWSNNNEYIGYFDYGLFSGVDGKLTFNDPILRSYKNNPIFIHGLFQKGEFISGEWTILIESEGNQDRFWKTEKDKPTIWPIKKEEDYTNGIPYPDGTYLEGFGGERIETYVLDSHGNQISKILKLKDWIKKYVVFTDEWWAPY